MELREADKLIISMLTSIMKKLEIDDIDPELVNGLIYTGHSWLLPVKYGWLDTCQDNEAVGREVMDHLDMWAMIEKSFGLLSEKEQREIVADYGKESVRFRGYNRQREDDYFVAARILNAFARVGREFPKKKELISSTRADAKLIEDLNICMEFQGRDLASYNIRVASYRQMYKVFEPLRHNFLAGVIPFRELTEILYAQGR